MNLIFKKRLKRKRIKEGRVQCHGNVLSCKLIERFQPGFHRRFKPHKQIIKGNSYNSSSFGSSELLYRRDKKVGFIKKFFNRMTGR